MASCDLVEAHRELVAEGLVLRICCFLKARRRYAERVRDVEAKARRDFRLKKLHACLHVPRDGCLLS